MSKEVEVPNGETLVSKGDQCLPFCDHMEITKKLFIKS